MHTRSRMNLTLATVLALALLAVPAASARTLPGQASLLPASPTTTDTLHVAYRPSASDGRYDTYSATVHVLARPSDSCRTSKTVELERPSPTSRTVTADIAPQGSHVQPYPWCSGRAVLSVVWSDGIAVRTDGMGSRPDRRVARRTIKLRPPRSSGQEFGTGAVIQVLSTSAATVTAAGRPGRTLGLGGVFAGFISGKYVVNSDFLMRLKPTSAALGVTPSGLTVASLVTDPLCAAGAIRTSAPLASRSPSQMTFLRNGVVNAHHVLDADPSTLAGCAGAPSGTVTIDLPGRLGTAQLAGAPAGGGPTPLLSDVLLTGTVAGVPVGGGVAATVSLALHVKVGIFD